MNKCNVHYIVSLEKISKHLLTITCLIENPVADSQIFTMPNWIPGSYLIRNLAKNIVAFEAMAGDEKLKVQKLNKNIWQVFSKHHAKISIAYDVYCYDESPRAAMAMQDRVFFDGCHIFLEPQQKSEQEIQVTILKPEGWDCITSMQEISYNSYLADNFYDLIDHPFLIGRPKVLEFYVHNISHKIAISGHIPTNVDLSLLTLDVQNICVTQADFFGDLPLTNSYIFFLHVTANAYGGLEHKNSSSLIAAYNNLPILGSDLRSDNYITLLGLFSHEYFHLWNVKRIKPEVFVNHNLHEEVYTYQLWIFEGITAYYDDLFLLKAKIITPTQYVSLLTSTINRVEYLPGREKQTLESSSFDAWIKFYQPNEGSNNNTVSYYTKGSLVALCLDILLFTQSEGKISLSTVMKVLWNKFGKNSIGLPEQYFESLVSDIAGVSYSDFFELAVRSTSNLPLEVLLGKISIKYIEDRQDIFNSIGFKLTPGTTKISYVQNDTSAELFDLCPQDEIIAVNGLKVVAGNCSTIINNCVFGNPIKITLFRQDVLLEKEIHLPLHPLTRCKLELNTQSDQKFLQWLESV